ncbi:hypothetical protein JK628_02320 [Shewanella sp. KX20019]|uniref:hypothetical protein n=1 Tax=Shewanella sp. KX20019 TaxID=2803864 RepID=UPI00192789AE|nr:hypothetical protein [Shewanella sp. KX20019]QQX80729.1 hypothetical protein JK628_02320 [Shewanella sp. KX20019]
MENSTIIKPFQRVGYALIGITLTFLAIHSSYDNDILDYVILLSLTLSTAWITHLLWTQRIVFTPSEVTFIKMMETSDTSMPKTLTLNYQDIDSVRLLGDHLFIHSSLGKINFPLKPKSSLAAKLKLAFEAKGITFEVNSCIA